MAEWRESGTSSGAPRVALVMVTYALASAAFVIALSLAHLGADSPLSVRLRSAFGATAVLGFTLADLTYFRLFRRHLDWVAVELGWEALRSKSLRLGASDALALVSALLVVGAAFVLLHAHVSRYGARFEARLRGLAGGLVVLGLVTGLLHERLWDEQHVEAARLARTLPWATNLDRLPERLGEQAFGTAVDQLVHADLRAARLAVEKSTPMVRERPNLLIVHVESLRADVFTPELMPELTRIALGCSRPPRHYSTGNNTGTGVFGLTTGLFAWQYPLSRDEPRPALPLVVLKKLGYRIGTHFANNLKTYDDIFEVVFGGLVDDAFVPADGPADQMDRAVVSHYLASLAEHPGPRFDYVVLDSTHYDYGYPKEFERHTPAGTLDLGVSDGIELGRRARERIGQVKNRYLNAVGWVDTQIAAIVTGLDRAGKLGNTLFVVVGDHGESFWEHETVGHGTSLDEQQIRVASVFCGSKLAERPASHADVFPTWFDQMQLSGVDRAFMSGESLRVRPASETLLAGMGVTGRFRSTRFVALGPELKVHFDNAGSLPIRAVTDLDDRPVSVAPGVAERVLLEALRTKRLVSP